MNWPAAPTAVKNELAGISSDQMHDYFLRASNLLHGGTRVDEAVRNLESQGFSYDTAYWLVIQAQLYGNDQDQATYRKSLWRKTHRTILGWSVLTCSAYLYYSLYDAPQAWWYMAVAFGTLLGLAAYARRLV